MAHGREEKISSEGLEDGKEGARWGDGKTKFGLFRRSRGKEFGVHDSSSRVQNAILFSIVMMVSTVYNGVCSKIAHFPLSSVLRSRGGVRLFGAGDILPRYSLWAIWV